MLEKNKTVSIDFHRQQTPLKTLISINKYTAVIMLKNVILHRSTIKSTEYDNHY